MRELPKNNTGFFILMIGDMPNEDEGSTFDIDWAVDKKGNKVNLPGIDFIKVYTGVRQNCGWLGEVSTEVCGVEDLHLLVK